MTTERKFREQEAKIARYRFWNGRSPIRSLQVYYTSSS